MVCLLLLVPSVLGVAVGWSACSRWGVLPVAVVVLDGEPVGCAACSQYPRHPASGEGVAVVSVGGMVCLLIGGRSMCCLSVSL